MAKETQSKPETEVPASGQAFLNGSPPLPVAGAKAQEEAWSMLRRYRRQVAKLSPAMRRFIVESLAADLAEENAA